MTNKPLALVTGGAGFVGSHMVDLLLSRGYAVRVIDDFSTGSMENLAQHKNNGDLDVFQRDIRRLKPESRLFADVQYVFHVAGIGAIVPSIENPAEYMSVNVQGTVRVLECARRAMVKKFVYAASSSCYGITPAVLTSESRFASPQYPYALSKYLGEQTTLHWHQVYGLPVNSMRIFNAYGRRARTTDAYGAVFGVFLRQKLAGQPLTIVGAGEQSRDFVHVTDVADAFLRAAETQRTGDIWNVGAGNPRTINYLAGLIGGLTVHVPERPGEPDATWADISKAKRDLGWRPRIRFEDGVAEMLHHIEDWRDAPLWTPESIESATKPWFEALAR